MGLIDIHCAVLNRGVVSNSLQPVDGSLRAFSVHGDCAGKYAILLHIKYKHNTDLLYRQRTVGFPWWFSGKEPTCQCRRHGFDPGSRRSPREDLELGLGLGLGNGHPLQYSCLGNPMDFRGAWQATVYGVTKELDLPTQQ